MKIKLFFQFGSMLLALLMFSSCEKSIQELDQSEELFLKSGSKDNAEIKYRLVVESGLSNGYFRSYHYNDKGLVDEFHISRPNEFSWSATMEYDENNIMSKARFYITPEEFYDIVLTYENDKLVKETWYYPGTMDVFDYYINTYNNEGQLVKRDEPLFELYTLFYYYDDGNFKGNEIFYQGNLYVGYEFEYSKKIKNPFATVTGLPVTLFILDDLTVPYWGTTFKQYINDENGNQVVLSEMKFEDTEIKTGPHHYPIYIKSYDFVNDIWTETVWEYENYARKRESGDNPPINASIGLNSNFAAPDHFKLKGEALKQELKKMRIKHEIENRAVTK